MKKTKYDLVQVKNISTSEVEYSWNASDPESGVRGVIAPGATVSLPRFLAEGFAAPQVVKRYIIDDEKKVKRINDADYFAQKMAEVLFDPSAEAAEPSTEQKAEEKTMAELREEAKAKGIKVKFGAKKEELAKTLNGAN